MGRRNGRKTRHQHQAEFILTRRKLDTLAGRQLVHLEAHMLPTSRRRGDAVSTSLSIRRVMAGQEFRHADLLNAEAAGHAPPLQMVR
ncbi:hypothetical protein D3C84_965580 [compost metagenome]